MVSRHDLLLNLASQPVPTRRNLLMARALREEDSPRKKYQPRVRRMPIAGPNAQTNFLNSNRRRIYRSAGGRFFVRAADGKKQYSPKAAFHVNKTTGSTGPVSSSHAIPQAIRPKGLPRRKATTRYGTGGLGATIGKNLALLFAEPVAAPKRGRGRPSKYASANNRKAARAAYAKAYRANVKAGRRTVMSRGFRSLPRGNVFNAF